MLLQLRNSDPTSQCLQSVTYTIILSSWVPMAHACNPSYSGGRDQEDYGSKPAWATRSQDPILKKPITKKGLMEWLKVQALSLSPSIMHTQKRLF
jgi:hypothetical protein